MQKQTVLNWRMTSWKWATTASVDTIADLSVAIRAHQPGDVIQLDVVRDNVSTTVEATLGEAAS